MFLSNNFDFVCTNYKQVTFANMHPTMSSEYFWLVIILLLTDLSKYQQETQHAIEIEC